MEGSPRAVWKEAGAAFRDHEEPIQRAWDRYARAVLVQAEADCLSEHWSWATDPNDQEWLALADAGGNPTGVLARRWLVHLLGLQHAAAHVAVFTPSGLIVLQRRSLHKAQFPGAWDLSVTGHVSLPAEASAEPVDYRAAAERELREELGVSADAGEGLLSAPGLQPVGSPQVNIAEGVTAGRPWRDVEWCQLYRARLTAAGMGRLDYATDEIAGLLLCTPDDALAVLAGQRSTELAAAGALESLRRLLAGPSVDASGPELDGVAAD
jgi:isopentenyldiphosphate isomerase